MRVSDRWMRLCIHTSGFLNTSTNAVSRLWHDNILDESTRFAITSYPILLTRGQTKEYHHSKQQKNPSSTSTSPSTINHPLTKCMFIMSLYWRDWLYLFTHYLLPYIIIFVLNFIKIIINSFYFDFLFII